MNCPHGLYHEKEMAETKIDHLFVFTHGFNYPVQLSALAALARLLEIKPKAYDVNLRFSFFSFFKLFLKVSKS